MMNCNYIGGNEFETFETIVDEKNNPGKTILTNIKARIENSYNQYLDRFDELEAKASSEFTDTEVEEKSYLQGCYSSLTKSSKIVKAAIYESQPDVLKTFCPFCLLDKPKTLDHYVGKKEFPEYSFLIKNLIPCCYDCNQTKGDIWRVNSKRRFIHFYNDDFFEHQFLFAELVIVQDTPTIEFSLKKPDELNDSNFQIIQWHFEDLKLIKQYKERCNTLLSTKVETLKKSLKIGITKQQLLSQLKASESDLANKFGVNYWKSAMFQCVANNINILLLF